MLEVTGCPHPPATTGILLLLAGCCLLAAALLLPSDDVEFVFFFRSIPLSNDAENELL